jgi:hypothetical protein
LGFTTVARLDGPNRYYGRMLDEDFI